MTDYEIGLSLIRLYPIVLCIGIVILLMLFFLLLCFCVYFLSFFLPRDDMLARYTLSSCRRASVRPFVRLSICLTNYTLMGVVRVT